jgi:hypothetical protein
MELNPIRRKSTKHLQTTQHDVPGGFFVDLNQTTSSTLFIFSDARRGISPSPWRPTYPSMTPRTKRITKKWLARFALIVIMALILSAVGVAITAGVMIYQGKDPMTLANKLFAMAGIEELQHPFQKGEPLAKSPDTNQVLETAQEIAEKEEKHESLPSTGFLARVGLGNISPDRKSNKADIDAMVADLSDEIGSTENLGPIRELRKLREERDEWAASARSTDPEIKKQAEANLAANKKRKAELEKQAHAHFQALGIDLTMEQVQSLGASPNSEDLTAMMAAFTTLKKVNAKMEEKLRKNPTQASAQQYYATHLVLLRSLDEIQQNAISKIEGEHLAKAKDIEEQAKQTAEAARQILQSNPHLSENERLALKWNLDSCRKTQEMSQRTQRRLEANLKIISNANDKLRLGSIATAENCLMTAKLQREILTLDTSGEAEIAKIEALTVPQLAAVNFADPEKPEVSR